MKAGIFFIITLIVCTDILDTISQLCVKSAVNHLDMHIHSLKNAVSLLFLLLRKKRLLISLISSAASFFVWLFVLSKVDLNLAYSIDSMRYVFIAVASLIFLKERIGVLRWLSIASVVFGIMMVTLS